ncbi:AAA family ATPase [Thermosulfurimonas dismutans]|uniref:ATPase AAA-type core domain-containing protein n=1 Tax=Thermosulfurimonas dismutans TaxID=999894 RepID=A0A179D3I6_9BACT|nr:AAA family ATPase [Thermosulfurimonas dismutans]OAQ20644.1 hypothetical protein TDIS_1259 [Thermosulfurimonas dismutans]
MELILDIKRLGPVKDSRIVWRPLTVFIGPNNTGKTYTAYLIHALLNTYPDQCGLGEEKISELFLHERLKFNFEELKEQWIEAWKKEIAESMLPNFWRKYFGIENKIPKLEISLITKEEKVQKLEFEGDIPISGIVGEIDENTLEGAEVGRLFYSAFLKKDGNIFEVYIPYDSQDEHVFGEYLEEYDTDTEYYFFEETFCEEFAYFLGFPRHNLIIPSERTSFLFYRQWFVLKNQLTQLWRENISIKKWRKKLFSLLQYIEFPEVFEDFLTFLLLSERKKVSQVYDKVIALLEQKLLKGRINFKKDEFWFNFGEGEIKISGASSGVKALLPLEKFLRSAPEGAFLVIDEPEMHLHPEAQVILAIALAMAVNLGLRVLLTTHSPYILDTFNFLAWSYRIREKIKENGLSSLEERLKNILKAPPFEVPEEALLDPSRFSAYFFRTDGQVEDIRKIPKEVPEVDIDWSTFSQVSEALWEKLGLLGELQDEILKREQ